MTEHKPDNPADRIRPFQWKPGQSGNPGGRPKSQSMVALLRQVLEQEHNGRPLKEVLAERIVKEALSGKFAFAKELLDRIDGLPGKEPKGDGTVRIVVADYRTQTEREGKADDIRRLAFRNTVEREGTAEDIRNLMCPPEPPTPPEPTMREFTKLRDFYTQCPAQLPPDYRQQDDPREGGSSGT